MIRVNDDYIIEIDNMNYTAKRDTHRKTIKKNPNTLKDTEVELYVTVGFFSDLTSAIKGIIKDTNTRDLSSGVYDLEEAVSLVIENNRKVSELLERALEV